MQRDARAYLWDVRDAADRVAEFVDQAKSRKNPTRRCALRPGATRTTNPYQARYPRPVFR